MKKLMLLVLMLCLVAVISGCATTSNSNHLPAFNNARPHSILIVPPINNVTDVQATTSVLATLPFFLAEKGFYVFPVNTVKTLLEFEGYYEPAEVHAVAPEKLTDLFKADSVLFVTIHEWTSKYVVFATVTEVDFEYRLFSSDGALLWEKRLMMQYSPNNNGNSGLAGLLVNAIGSAIERASPNYIPLTKSMHNQAINLANKGIPIGPYHPNYNKYYSDLDMHKKSDEKITK